MVAERRLYDAATKGDVSTLQYLLHQDPYLLEAVSFPFSRNLLHIAITHGKPSTVDEVLRINPRLARILDSQKLSPLHIAVEEGNLETVKRLLLVAPETCWWRDSHDMNPVHVAAMDGHVELLEELLQCDLFPGMERLGRGQTVLHLCVKHGQLRALKVLVEKLGELVCAKDDDGETLLHLAVRCNQVEDLKEAKVFYKDYATDCGFQVPKATTVKSKDKKIVWRYVTRRDQRTLPIKHFPVIKNDVGWTPELDVKLVWSSD